MAFSERLQIIIDAVTGKASSDLKGFGKDVEDVDKKTDKATRGHKSKMDTFAKATVIGYGAKQVIDFAGEVINAGAALESMDAKAETVFGGQIDRVKKWADANAGAMGVTKTEAIAAGAAIADLLKPMGFTEEAATDQSLALLDLSAALSAWSGGAKSAAEVSEILAKAMLGEREQLKTLGISITEAEVKTRLLRDGNDKLTGAQLQQAKATATQQLIMEKSTDAQKAWADGSMDAAKAANELKAQMAQLKEDIQRGLLPVVQSLVFTAQEMSSIDWSKPFSSGGDMQRTKEAIAALDASAKAMGLTYDEVIQQFADGTAKLDENGKLIVGVGGALDQMTDSSKEAAQAAYELSVKEQALADATYAARTAFEEATFAHKQFMDSLSEEEAISRLAELTARAHEEMAEFKTITDSTRFAMIRAFDATTQMQVGLNTVASQEYKIAVDTGDLENAQRMIDNIKLAAAAGAQFNVVAEAYVGAGLRNLMEGRGITDSINRYGANGGKKP